MPHEFQTDIDAIGDIAAVTTILDVVCRMTGMGFAAVARVTEGRWVACEVLDKIDFGLTAGGELKVETTICHEIRQHLDTVAIENVAEDTVYCGHLTPSLYGFQSYISTPILLQDGSFFGTLCAIDPKPARVNTPETIGTFKLFAELIASHLDARAQMELSNAKLLEEKASSELREQFIAVLGHDLRNPLASLQAGTKMILRSATDDKTRMMLSLMQKSIDRMANLIDNVLDFARGRLGGGISLNRNDREPLQDMLTQIVDELRLGWPERTIETAFDLSRPVLSDPARLGQLLSNLLSNALTHGAAEGPVRVGASVDDSGLELWVANSGAEIPADALERLFQPFTHTENNPNKQGLGLGLYIASQIAAAHGGHLSVQSSADETRFTLRMPAT